jgi:hypothetical protein
MTVVKVIGGYLEIESGAAGSPPGIWGGRPPNYVDIGGPGAQPHPSHPIAPGGRPPGTWGGEAPPWLDHTLPGVPPGFWGGEPPPWIDNSLPGNQPIAGWPPVIMPPIFIPPGEATVPPPENQAEVEWHTGWSAEEGWVTVGVIKTDAPIPTPSGAARSRRGK